MTNNDRLIKKAEELENLKNQMKALQNLIDECESEIKFYMDFEQMQEFRAGKYSCHYTDVSAERFDSKRFKAENPDMFALYIKPGSYKRFTFTVILDDPAIRGERIQHV